MSLAIVESCAEIGTSAAPVIVEVHLSVGLPSFTIVGLPEAAVRESKDRVRSAIINSQFEFPRKRITVNLAPADLPKEGGRFDLPIAIGILVASEQLPQHSIDKLVFLGELALSGELRDIRGGLVSSMALSNTSKALIISAASAARAAINPAVNVYGAPSLMELTAHLAGQQSLLQAKPTATSISNDYPDMRDVKGHGFAKRGLEIAACGGHGLIMIGPPGTGKSMLARRLPGILPPLSITQAMESAAVRSLSSREMDMQEWQKRPFRSPHHSASSAALIGGGSVPRPGEVSLAHHGVLFLDELPEFSRQVLETLREPIETGEIHISRAASKMCFPARFMLVAASNPCPCGYLGDESGRCRCHTEQVQRYFGKISGPLLDRIDIHLEVPRQPLKVINGHDGLVEAESSEIIAKRVAMAQALQYQRQGCLNSDLAGDALTAYCAIDDELEALLAMAMEKYHLSVRAYHRILKVARSIADLAAVESLTLEHLALAIRLRCLDKGRG